MSASFVEQNVVTRSSLRRPLDDLTTAPEVYHQEVKIILDIHGEGNVLYYYGRADKQRWFEPRRVVLTYVWEVTGGRETGDWSRSNVHLSGNAIKKDGTPGNQELSQQAFSGGWYHENAADDVWPLWLRLLAESWHPTGSYVRDQAPE